jgi:DNA-binding MarR family transcriptional regulator
MSRRDRPTQLDAEALETWSALATMLEWLPATLDAQLQRDSGITHFEYGILFALLHAPDRALRMSTLAGYSNSSLSRLSRAVTRLERKGWVDRSPDPSDGRYTVATLTDEGAAHTADATPGHAQAVDSLVLEPLTAAQARQLRQICRRITGAIRDESGWHPQ